MKRVGLVVGGIALAVHGLIEVLGIFFLNAGAFSSQKFIFDQLNQNAQVVCMLGVIFGIVRIVAAVGVFMNRKWGLALGVLISTVTYMIMTFYLPMGIADGIFSGIVLVTLLMAYYGKQVIVPTVPGK